VKKTPPGTEEDKSDRKGDTPEETGQSDDQQKNTNENQVVHTRSVSIKNVLMGKPGDIPVVDDEIGENDQVDEVKNAGGDIPAVTGEEVQRVWNEYAASIEKSQPRIYTTLKQHSPSLTARGVIRVQLNTNAQRENFVHRIKPGLVKYMREHLADMEYVFETNLIENETTVKKVYTDQDKLDYLIDKNPDLEKLKSRFNLDFDN